jgi:hypothetical protein
MKRTVVGLFDTRAEADQAVRDLEAAGIRGIEISVMTGAGSDAGSTAPTATDDDDPVGAGVLAGGLAGMLAGLPLLAIPGIGPAVIAGWLATTLTGALAGGLIGALAEEGVGEEDAQVYAEAMRRGGVLVLVRADEADVRAVEQILVRAGAVDIRERERAYRESGWTGFDETAPLYTAEDAARDRERQRAGI